MDTIVSQKKAHKLHDKAYKIYTKHGQGAVFDYAIKIGLTEYKYCDGCETDSPVIGYKDFDDKIYLFCFVCGIGKFVAV